MPLRKFRPDELVLSHQEAWQVLVYFFGGNAGMVPGWLTDEDRSFAQALLLEAVDKSYAMSWVQTLFEASAKPNASVQGILKSLAKKAARDWLSNAKPTDLASAKIYASVKNQLTRNWRSAWAIRTETDGPIY